MGQESRFLFVKKPSSQVSSQARASRIKNKLLNTSSFLKASLKRNNKDLASALTVEKQKSRLLEMEVVDLRRETLALRFDLADKRHTLKNLILICKDFRTSALHHFGRMAELFPSNLDVGDVFDVDKSGLADAKDDNIQMERIVLPPPESMVDETCPVKQTSVDLPEKNSPEIQNATNDGESRPSTLRTELDRFSRLFSEPETGLHPPPCVHLIPSVIVSSENPQPPVCTDDDVDHPSSTAMETELEPTDRLETTVLLDTAMEMTVSNSTEIVTVETKTNTRKSSLSKNVQKMETGEQVVVKMAGKKKRKKKLSQVSCGDDGPEKESSINSELTEIRNPVTVLQTNSFTEEATTDKVATENEPLIIQRKPSVSSRIPKLMKLTEQELFKIKCHKTYSASKTDMSVSKETSAGSTDSSSQRGRKTASRETKRRNTQQLPSVDKSKEKENKLDNEESLAHTDDPTESEDTTCPSVFVRKPEANERSRKEVSQDNIIRRTFEIPVTGNGLLSSSEQQIFIQGTNSNSLAEDLTTDTNVSPLSDPCGRSSETYPAFRHRNNVALEEAPAPWEPARQATQEPTDIPETLTSKRMLEAQPFDSLCSSDSVPDHGVPEVTEFPKPKRCRTEKTGRSPKTESVWEPKSHVNDRRRKTNKRSRKTQEITLFQENDCNPRFSTNVFSQKGGEGVHAIASQKQSHRETFTIGTLGAPSCTPKDCSSFTTITPSNVSVAEVHRSDASRVGDGLSLEELLTDERPPWDTLDVSAVNSEMDPQVSSPRRTGSGRISVYSKPASVVTGDESPAGRVPVASLTNILLSPDKENRRQPRRCNSVVVYKEPSLNRKMRRGDKFTDTQFLSSPIWKDQSHRKKKNKRNNKSNDS